MTVFSKWAGLHTAHNYVSSVPEGALSTANNCVIVSQDTVEPRRGQYSLSYSFGTTPSRANALWAYGSDLLVQYGTSIARDTGSAFSAYSGTFTPVDDALCRMRGVEAAQNFYINTAEGTKVLDAAAGSFSTSGVPQCLDVYEIGSTVSTSGYLANDKAAAYRAVIGQKDANGQWRYGAPSQRVIVANTDITLAIGALVRAANVVTVTIAPAAIDWLKYLAVGNAVTLTTNEANFTTGVKTITGINTAANTFTYAEVAADATSTVAHTFRILARSSKLSISIPNGLSTSDVIQVFRTETADNATTDPGDETYQVDEVNPPAAVTVTSGGVVATGTSVVVTSNAHPYVVGQALECSGHTNIPSGTNIVTAVTANTFTYVDPSASTQTSTSSITYTPRNVVVDDNTPETVLGDPLYTNPNTGDGLESSRYEPPVAKDMCRFAGRLWWLNTTDKHRVEVQILGIGSPDGIQDGDWLQFTVDGIAYRYTANGATLPGTIPTQRKFQIWSHETPLVNIERTAQELVRCINLDDSSIPFYAIYSGQNDVPGKIMIVEKAIGGETIYAQASRAASWSPILPGNAGTTAPSSNDADPAGVIWSEEDQPEAVPLANKLRVDSKNDPILRGMGLREALFVFKQKGGLYVIPNQQPFKAKELDPTCRLLAPDTVVPLNNQLYALTEQGLVSVTEAGVDILGWPLDYDVRTLLNRSRSTITRIPFSVAYESERTLLLWLPTDSSSTYSTQAYVYNHATRAFTRWEMNRTCGLVMPGTDILYMGSGSSNTLARERKSFDFTDYADESLTVTLNAVSGVNLTLSSTTGVSVGDVITDGAGSQAIIDSILGNIVTTSALQNWTVSSTLTVYNAFEVYVETVPLSISEPGLGKQVSRAVYSFRDAQFQRGKATASTDDSPANAEYQFAQYGYGTGGYGVPGYGNPADPLNKFVTLGVSGGFIKLGFKIREARAKWRLLAVTAQIAGQSERGR